MRMRQDAHANFAAFAIDKSYARKLVTA